MHTSFSDLNDKFHSSKIPTYRVVNGWGVKSQKKDSSMHHKVCLHKRHYKTAWHSKHLFLIYTYIEIAIYTNICLSTNQIAPVYTALSQEYQTLTTPILSSPTLRRETPYSVYCLPLFFHEGRIIHVGCGCQKIHIVTFHHACPNQLVAC